MIRKKPAPHLMRGVQRFSEKIMRKNKALIGSPARGKMQPAKQ
jgi:hypothetical protein